MTSGSMRDLIISWDTLKTIKARDHFRLYYVARPQGTDPETYIYEIIATNHYFFYKTMISGPDAIDFETNFKSAAVEVGSMDDAIALTHPPISSEFVQKVEIASRVGSGNFNQYTICTFNFCKKTTWYQDYLQHGSDVSPIVLSADGTFSVYSSNISDWINVDDFGVVAQEYNSGPPYYQLVSMWQKDGTLAPKSDYRPKIYKNGTLVTSGYTIDYATGTVTFADANNSGDTIAAVFRTTVSATFILRPRDGYRISIPHVEINTTTDMDPSTIRFEVYGGDPTYSFLADAYCGYRMSYTGHKALYGLSTVGMDVYQPMGSTTPVTASEETGWSTDQVRGLTNPLVEIPYDFGGPGKFGKAIVLSSKAYHVMRMSLLTTTALPGEYCSTTFYVEEDQEPPDDL